MNHRLNKPSSKGLRLYHRIADRGWGSEELESWVPTQAESKELRTAGTLDAQIPNPKCAAHHRSLVNELFKTLLAKDGEKWSALRHLAEEYQKVKRAQSTLRSEKTTPVSSSQKKHQPLGRKRKSAGPRSPGPRWRSLEHWCHPYPCTYCCLEDDTFVNRAIELLDDVEPKDTYALESVNTLRTVLEQPQPDQIELALSALPFNYH